MKDVNYVIGRLQGLNELVKILKDLVDKKGNQNPDIIATVTDHVSEQLNSILSDLDNLDVEPQHMEKLQQIKEKHSEPARDEEETEEAEEEEPERKPIRDQSTVKEEDLEDEESSGDDSKDKIEKHEKTVDDLLKDLESMKT